MACFDFEMGSGLLKSGKFSDFTIHVSDKSFKVHRAILSPVSFYFERLMNNESDAFKEGIRREVTIPETTVLAFAKLLIWVYAQTDEPCLHDVYEVWPDLRPPEYVSPTEYHRAVIQSEEEREHLEASYEKSVHDNLVVDAESSIQLYSLADQYNMKTLQLEARRPVLRQLRLGLPVDVTASSDVEDGKLTPLEVSQLLKLIYQVTPPNDDKLRAAAMAHCIRCEKSLEGNDAPANVIMRTIMADADMFHDWIVGLEVAKAVRMPAIY